MFGQVGQDFELITKIRKGLRSAGLIHVTGLTYKHPDGSVNTIGRERAYKPETWNHNHGALVVVTRTGEIWLGYRFEEQETLIRFLVGIGFTNNGWVPCSNYETIRTTHLLRRSCNPDWMPPQG